MAPNRRGTRLGGRPMFAQATPAQRSNSKEERRSRGWWGDPRTAVLAVLASVVVLGGGLRWYRGWKARRAVGLLREQDVTPETVREAGSHGREGLFELFRLLSDAETPALRHAAGAALSRIWSDDDLIPEEEQAVVRRGFAVDWKARRKYPRSLRTPIPFQVSYGVPFLESNGEGIDPEHLEWSHRILGTGRASLESFTPWRPGTARVSFTIAPEDFPTNGPHRLVLEARCRTGSGLTSSWEINLPHVSLQFEFDSHLTVEALQTLPDETRRDTLKRAVRLDGSTPAGDEPRFLDLSEDFVLRNPPGLTVKTPLPCDLAHRLELEMEGISGRFAAGEVVVSGQGTREPVAPAQQTSPIIAIQGMPADALERPGPRRLRAVLTADPNLGWADPEVRAIWPESIETDWVEVQVIRK